MNDEYIRLLDLVFPVQNLEIEEFRNGFEQLEPQDKINAIAANQEELRNYIEQLKSHRQDEDAFSSMQIELISIANSSPNLIKVKEFIENDEWHLIVDFVEKQENYLLSMDFEEHIKQRNLRKELKAYFGMHNNMGHLSNYILENML